MILKKYVPSLIFNDDFEQDFKVLLHLMYFSSHLFGRLIKKTYCQSKYNYTDTNNNLFFFLNMNLLLHLSIFFSVYFAQSYSMYITFDV